MRPRAASVCLIALLAGGAPAAGGDEPPAAPPPPAFLDLARAAGLPTDEVRRAAAVDLDGDGRADLVFDAGKRVFLNRTEKGRLTFVEATKETGLRPETGRGADVLAWGDVDGDGDVDCFYGRYGDFAAETKKKNDDGLRSEIFLNDGKGRFTRRAGSGVGAHAETTATATFLDHDLDGVLDLYVGNWYVKYGEGLECHPSRLYHGVGDGTFVDVTEAAGMLGVEEPGRRDSRRPVYGVTATDWNDDGRPDLLVCAYGRQWNILWRNDGGGKFTDVAEATTFDGDADQSGVYPKEARDNPRLKDLVDEKPFRSNGNTFDAAVADFDADGDVDVFLAEITHWWAGPSSDKSALLVNRGKAAGFSFAREERGIVRTHEGARWNQGDLFAGWLDVGNDGRLDLFVASGDYPDEQRLRLWLQTPEHGFEEATERLGLRWTNCAQPTVADFDLDLRADLCLGTTNNRLPAEVAKTRSLAPALFAQTASAGGGHGLRLILQGLGKGHANRSAIGTRVTVRAGPVTAVREVTGCRGHAGHQDEFALTFGLGSAAGKASLTVRWPDAAGTLQTFEDVPLDRAYGLRQGDVLKPLP
jgi:hypothetical protein